MLVGHAHRPRGARRPSAVATVLTLGAGLLVAAFGAPAAASPVVSPAVVETIPTPPAVSWSRCRGGLGGAGAECGFVTVPLDYRDRSSGTIQLAVSRVQHTTAAYQGVILVNPGGPGGSGLGYSTLAPYVPQHAGAQYDWIGFDPRGVGSSIPAVRCDPSYFAYDRPDYVATTLALQQSWLDRSAAYSQACASRNDLRLLNHLTTADNVRDMESIRLALGQQQISIYGFSYGTYLAQVYATLFPRHLRRAVLDSNVDPRRIWYGGNLDQDTAFEFTVKTFFTWVARYDAVYHLGTSPSAVEALYRGTLDQLRRTPQNRGRVGPDEWNDAFVAAGYSQFTWTAVAGMFASAIHDGDFTGVTASIVGPTDDDNGFAMYQATTCTDSTSWPKSYARTWKPDSIRLATTAPFLTWLNTWFNSPCLTWPAAPHREVTVDGAAAPPILLIDEQYDAATSYAGSVEVRARFPSSSLIQVVGGTSHANTLNGNTCTDDAIAAYLANGTLPTRQASATGPDRRCRALPEPTPGAVAAAGSRAADPRVATPYSGGRSS